MSRTIARALGDDTQGTCINKVCFYPLCMNLLYRHLWVSNLKTLKYEVNWHPSSYWCTLKIACNRRLYILYSLELINFYYYYKKEITCYFVIFYMPWLWKLMDLWQNLLKNIYASTDTLKKCDCWGNWSPKIRDEYSSLILIILPQSW